MKSTGLCSFCKKTFSGSMMAKHLQSCPGRIKAQKPQSGEEKVFLLKAGAGPFWVYFETVGSSTLKDVDIFLRDLWLECCGHLSAFTIGNTQYSSSPDREYGDQSMNIQLNRVLRPGIALRHEYDFGSTTELGVKCISERFGKVRKGISILARNNLPEFACNECGKPAKEICAQCIGEGEEGLLCKQCAKTHECGEEMLLPVVNSPRMGMCGYSG